MRFSAAQNNKIHRPYRRPNRMASQADLRLALSGSWLFAQSRRQAPPVPPHKLTMKLGSVVLGCHAVPGRPRLLARQTKSADSMSYVKEFRRPDPAVFVAFWLSPAYKRARVHWA